MKLSVVVNTKNAEQTLAKALESVSFADEIIVVDMKSTDKTVEIARQHTKKIFQHKDVGYVEPARNFALSKASGDWILVLDADEEVSPALAGYLLRIINGEINENFVADCYYVARKNIIWGQWIKHSGWWPDYILRFFKKGHVTWGDEIHSVPVTKGVVREIPAKHELALIHHNYQSVDQFIERLNRYTTVQSLNKKDRVNFEQEIELSSQILKIFTDEFLRRFFAQRGIEDGTHGTSLSLLQAMSEAVVQMKQWQLQGFKATLTQPDMIEQQLRTFQRELNYWLADWHVLHSRGLNKFYWQLRRKFQL